MIVYGSILGGKFAKSEYSPGNVTEFQAIAEDKQIVLKWRDPADTIIGNATLARWAGTKIVRKEGSYPENESDGTIVTNNTERNQYLENGFVDAGLVNGVEYYYQAFPCSDTGVVNTNTANRAAAKPQNVPPQNIVNFVAKSGNTQITLTWVDPEDTSGDKPVIWAGTKIVRKQGSYPDNELDGTVVVDNTVQNQYQTDGFVDTGLEDGEYYYQAFPYSTDEGINRNEENRAKASIGYKIYGVRIDTTNTNPVTAVEYTDDAVGMAMEGNANASEDFKGWKVINGNAQKRSGAYVGCGSKIYCIGGYVAGAVATTHYIYDTEVNTWSTGAVYPVANGTAIEGVAVGTKIYCFDNVNAYPRVYDTVANSWTAGLIQPSGVRYNFNPVVVGTKIYCIGGYLTSTAKYTNRVDIYDTVLGLWSTGTEQPDIWALQGCASVGNKIYCFGGTRYTYSGNTATTYIYPYEISKIRVYDTETDSWDEPIQTEYFYSNYCSRKCVTVGDKIYVSGSSQDYLSVYVYDAKTGVASKGPGLWSAHYNGGSFTALGKTIWAVGGCNFSDAINSYSSYMEYLDTSNLEEEDVWWNTDIFKNIKQCRMLKGMVNAYLVDYNSVLKAAYTVEDYEAISNTVITNGDFMVEIPKLAYLIYTEGDYLYVKVTANPKAKEIDSRFCFYAHTRDEEGDREHLYIGKYLGGNVNGYSYSGVVPDVSRTLELARNSVRADSIYRGEGYDLTHFHAYTLLQCLYLLMFKSLDSQGALGHGMCYHASARQNTGATNGYGMNFGSKYTQATRMCFLGIEDFWGNVYWRLDGLYTTVTQYVFTAFKDFNNTGNGYPLRADTGGVQTTGYMTRAQGTNETGFFPKATGGSTSTYFCDQTYLNPDVNYYVGSTWSTTNSLWNSADGIFGMKPIATTGASATVGIRVMYL